MDIINVIDRLDALVNTSTKVPATRSRLVDVEKVMELLEQLRLTIPQDVKAAQEVIERKDAILNQAQIDARRTRNEAEEEFVARLDQNEILVAARAKAQQLVEEADEKAGKLMERVETESRSTQAQSDAYVVQSLRSLEQELTSVLASVRKGLDNVGATIRV
jgi:septum formation inhibitor MinC